MKTPAKIALSIFVSILALIAYKWHKYNLDIYSRFPGKPPRQLRKAYLVFTWRAFTQQYTDEQMNDDTTDEEMDALFDAVYDELYPAQ